VSSPFLGEIRMFGGNFPPRSWAFCSGQLMSIAQNDALYSLIGTTYGGDGVVTFGLPDLRSRVPVHWGQGLGLSSYQPGQVGGAESITLQFPQIPSHTHGLFASSVTGNQAGPTGNTLAGGAAISRYAAGTPQVIMSDASIANAGSSQPHPNLQPFLAVSFIIALEGIFPSRN
jgi:microcystin-dependent protein